jgi:hypothetical protein
MPLPYRPATPAFERVIWARLAVAANSLTCLLRARGGPRLPCQGADKVAHQVIIGSRWCWPDEI